MGVGTCPPAWSGRSSVPPGAMGPGGSGVQRAAQSASGSDPLCRL